MSLKKSICLILVVFNITILSSFNDSYIENTVEEVKESQRLELDQSYRSFLYEEKIKLTKSELEYLYNLKDKTIKVKLSDKKDEYENIGTQNFILKAITVTFNVNIEIVENEEEADLIFVVGDERHQYDYTTNPFHNLSTMIFYDYTKVNIEDILKSDTRIGVSPYLYNYIKDIYVDDVTVIERELAEESINNDEIDFYYTLPYDKIDYKNTSKIITDIQYMRHLEQITLHLASNDNEYSTLINIISKVLDDSGRKFLEEVIEDEIKIIKERYFYHNLTNEQLDFLESDYVVQMIIEETPKLAFFDEYGNYTGYLIDYIDEIKKKTSMKIDVTILPEISKENALLLALSSDYDVIPYIRIQESALDDIDNISITESYFKDEIEILKRIDVEKITSVSSLIYKNVGIVYSPAVNNFLEEHLSTELKNVTYYSTYRDLILDIGRKNIDYIVVEPGFVEFIFQDSTLLVNSAINKRFESNFYMIVSATRDNEDYTDTISQILSKSFVVIDDTELRQKWFEEDAMYNVKTERTLQLKDISIISSMGITLLIYFLAKLISIAYRFNNNAKNTAYINKITNRYNNLALEKYIAKVDDFTLITLDIQQFKYLNDIYGNSIADSVFINLSNIFDYLSETYSFDTFTPSGGVVTICSTESDRYRINKLIASVRLIVKHINLYNELGYNVKIKMIVIDPKYTKDKDNIKQYSKQLFDKIKNTSESFARYNDKKKKKFDTNKKVEKLLVESMDKKVLPFFQPFISAKTGKVIGCETLARLKDGDTMYFPDQFLPVAISSGLMAEIDQKLFERTVKIRNELLEKGIIDEDFYFSVNISAPLLRRLDVQKLMDLRDELKVKDFSFIQIEVLEEQITEKEIKNILNIIELFEIRIAIDDFSAGHSSVFRINDFPCDVLKIDKGLLPIDFNETDKEKYKTVLSMIKDSREMKITCEGVETEEHVKFLKSQSVDIFQGYYYSRPVSIDILTDYIIKTNKV